jgi:tetratricopeptide (TPR) repeat protein
VGVILYEMVAGHPPFRGDDTRRLEARIRSRRPPEPAPGCPAPLQAVIAKLLAPRSEDRYDTPADIRADLERALAGQTTDAERLGWPDKVEADEPATRRVPRSVDDEPPTRRLAHAPAAAIDATQVVAVGPAATAAPPARTRRGGWIRTALVLVLVSLAGNEGCVMSQAQRVAATVPLQEFAGLNTAWTTYDGLRRRSYLGVGTHDLGLALERQTLVLAERVAANYRTPAPTVREAQWLAAARALERALAVSPNDAAIRGTLRYTQGHLRRIDGEADKGRRQTADAQRNFAEAVTAFREAATLRPSWPDPFLGLARTFIYGLEDIDRGADAINQAQKLGHVIGARETTQLADGYRARGENLERAAATLGGMPQEREFLTRAREAFRQALDLYTKIGDVPDAAAQVKATQRRLDGIDRKIAALDARVPSPLQLAPGTIVAPIVEGHRPEVAPWA